MFSFLLGWWGFPWGLIMTPIQVVRNIVEIFKAPDGSQPSEKLNNIVRVGIATRLVEEQDRT
ncbi:hypothetical protein QUF90_27500 [Desulfococcaceae bacterium HSG9]|nr:hypothetical protein [Desulfococcaceae bacterium HSG9]